MVWAPSHILPGVLVGASFSLFGAAAKPLAVLLAVLVLALWVILHAVRYAMRRGLPLFMAGVERMRIWAGSRDARAGRILFSLLDPSQHEARTIAALALLLAGAAWLFLGVLEDVVSGDPLVRADTAIYHALQGLRTTPGDSVMIAITEAGDTAVVFTIVIIVLLWLVWQRAWRTAAYWVVAIAGASTLNSVIKGALHRARPGELFYAGWSEFSFPSGHSTVNIVLYGFLAFLIAFEARPVWRLPIALAAATLTLLIAFSRIYLGAHWFSDVIGGMAFGTAWLALLGLTYRHRHPKRIEPGKLLLVALLALGLAGGFNVYRHHTEDVGRYAVHSTVPTMAAADWWQTAWQQVSAQRIDLAGELEEPLTIQWAGSLQGLQDRLLQKGWRAPAPWTPLSALTWLTPKADPIGLPVMPLLASGRLPSLTLVRQQEDVQVGALYFVLRIWAVDVNLANGNPAPLWVGSIVGERRFHPWSLFTWTSMQSDMNTPRNVLAAALEGGRLVARPDQRGNAGWDGRVLLARESNRPGIAYP